MEGALLSLPQFVPCHKHTRQVEQTSVAQLQALLSRAIEAISFILLLIDYNIGELIAQ